MKLRTERILVAGATGGVGRLIVRQLLDQGRTVRTLVRDVKQAQTTLGQNVELMLGDTRRPETLTPALAGIDIVMCATGSRLSSSDNMPQQVDYEGVRNLVEAAKSARVKHFLLVSSLAVTRPEHPLNRFGQVLTWKLRGEDTLRQSGLAYSVVRPGGLTDEPGGQKGIQVDQGDRITGRISRANVAEVCVQALDQPGARNVTFEIIEGDDAPPADWRAFFANLRSDF